MEREALIWVTAWAVCTVLACLFTTFWLLTGTYRQGQQSMMKAMRRFQTHLYEHLPEELPLEPGATSFRLRAFVYDLLERQQDFVDPKVSADQFRRTYMHQSEDS